MQNQLNAVLLLVMHFGASLACRPVNIASPAVHYYLILYPCRVGP